MGEDRSWRVALVPNTLYLAARCSGAIEAKILRMFKYFADIHFDYPNESLEGYSRRDFSISLPVLR
jgi:hypothetical protein